MDTHVWLVPDTAPVATIIAAGELGEPAVEVAAAVLSQVEPVKPGSVLVLQMLVGDPPHVLVAQQRLQPVSPPLVVQLLLQLIAVPARVGGGSRERAGGHHGAGAGAGGWVVDLNCGNNSLEWTVNHGAGIEGVDEGGP